MTAAGFNAAMKPGSMTTPSKSGSGEASAFQTATMNFSGQSAGLTGRAELQAESAGRRAAKSADRAAELEALRGVSNHLNGIVSAENLQLMESFSLRVSLANDRVYLNIPRFPHNSPHIPSQLPLSGAERIGVHQPAQTRLSVNIKYTAAHEGNPIAKLEAERARDHHGRPRYYYSYRTTNPRSERPRPQPKQENKSEPQKSGLHTLLAALGLTSKESS